MEPTPIYEEYPDMRYHEQEEMAQTQKAGFKVLGVTCGSNPWKQVHLEDELGNQHTALAFDSYCDYDELKEGNYVDGYIRLFNSKYNLVDYCKPERSLIDGESFTMPNGRVYKK